MLQVDIKSKAYPGKAPILKDVKFTLEEGEMMLILAPSGCGKTTLFKILMGDTNYHGTVKIDKHDRIVYVAQEGTLDANEKVYNAIYFTATMDRKRVPNNEIRKIVKSTMNSLGIMHVGSHKIDDISGGQYRRVQLAEAFVRNSDTLLLDEPDTGLDGFTSYILLSDIRDIVHNDRKKAIVISHNITEENLRLYDKILILAKDEHSNAASPVYYDSYGRIKSYFGESSMLRILKKLQTQKERGDGMGEFFHRKYTKEVSHGRDKIDEMSWR